MSNTTTISTEQFDTLVRKLAHLEKMLGALMEKLDMDTDEARAASEYKESYVYEEGEPEYGTDAWWEWSDKKAEEDRQAGRYTVIQNKEELKRFFDNL